MEFTEEGLKLVKTLKFAQMVDDYLSPWREQGVSDSNLTNLLAAVVSWAATGQAISEPPAGRQSYELTAFTLSHVTDIENLSANVGETPSLPRWPLRKHVNPTRNRVVLPYSLEQSHSPAGPPRFVGSRATESYSRRARPSRQRPSLPRVLAWNLARTSHDH
jgi:hypothetical protein